MHTARASISRLGPYAFGIASLGFHFAGIHDRPEEHAQKRKQARDEQQRSSVMMDIRLDALPAFAKHITYVDEQGAPNESACVSVEQERPKLEARHAGHIRRHVTEAWDEE